MKSNAFLPAVVFGMIIPQLISSQELSSIPKRNRVSAIDSNVVRSDELNDADRELYEVETISVDQITDPCMNMPPLVEIEKSSENVTDDTISPTAYPTISFSTDGPTSNPATSAITTGSPYPVPTAIPTGKPFSSNAVPPTAWNYLPSDDSYDDETEDKYNDYPPAPPTDDQIRDDAQNVASATSGKSGKGSKSSKSSKGSKGSSSKSSKFSEIGDASGYEGASSSSLNRVSGMIEYSDLGSSGSSISPSKYMLPLALLLLQ